MLTSHNTDDNDLAQSADDVSTQGIRAFKAGKSADENEYREGTAFWFCWRRGWEMAEGWAAARVAKEAAATKAAA